MANLQRIAILKDRYQQVRAMTEALCEPLATEDYGIQAMPDASPPKWHLGHVTWFFEQFILVPFAARYRSPNETYAFLFNSYYETAGAFFPRTLRGVLSRPTVEEVYRYRRHVDAQLLKLLEALPEQHGEEIETRLDLGIEHELQHQELLLMDTCYNFSINPLQPAYHLVGVEHVETPALGWQEIAGGVVEVGDDGLGFAYDNERPRHQVFLRDFRLATRLITNAEYLAFQQDGGYERADLWLSDGWQAVSAQRWQAPLYWREDGGRWTHFDLTGAHQLRLDEPVSHLSYFEAEAYARWAGKRLPTEFEWEHAARNALPDGNFLDRGLYMPQPARHVGLAQMYGDLWEWTQSAYLPYPGFRPLEGALGEYNGKFMCGQMVLRGGSCLTARDHIRSSYRNFFRPTSRWMYSGLRLAEDA